MTDFVTEVFGFRIPVTPAVILPMLVLATIVLAYVLYFVLTRLIRAIMSRTTADGCDAVVARITGMAYRTGSSHFTADPADPLASGFVVR